MIILQSGKAFRSEKVIFHKVISGIMRNRLMNQALYYTDQGSTYKVCYLMICPSLNFLVIKVIPYVMIILVPEEVPIILKHAYSF